MKTDPNYTESRKNLDQRSFRRRLFRVIRPPYRDERMDAYDILMLAATLVSVVPLLFRRENPAFLLIDRVTVFLFIIDYILRWVTADYMLHTKGWKPFVIYPFRPMAVIDLLSILPTISSLSGSLRLFRIVRLFRVLRMMRLFRIFRAVRYMRSIRMLRRVFVRQKNTMIALCWIALLYIVVLAVIIINVEPQTFDSLFDALYWSTVSLTTVGYGDLYPVTTAGRVAAMISSIFGIAIVAMPAGAITAGIMDEMNDSPAEEEEETRETAAAAKASDPEGGEKRDIPGKEDGDQAESVQMGAGWKGRIQIRNCETIAQYECLDFIRLHFRQGQIEWTFLSDDTLKIRDRNGMTAEVRYREGRVYLETKNALH